MCNPNALANSNLIHYFELYMLSHLSRKINFCLEKFNISGKAANLPHHYAAIHIKVHGVFVFFNKSEKFLTKKKLPRILYKLQHSDEEG